MDIREYIKQQVLVFDGAMGTYYAAKHRVPNDGCEAANLQEPGKVLEIHREYVQAGCRAIKTNTFAANMDNYGNNAEYLKQIIRAGYELACQAAEGNEVFVFADIGPVQLTDAKKSAADKYIEVADVFIDLGARNFLIETLCNDEGIEELTRHIKSRVEDAFIIVSFAVQPDGYTKEGCLGHELLQTTAQNSNIDVAGINCVSGPHHMHQYFKTVKKLSDRFSVMPNAGYPTVINNRTFFESSPDYFALKLTDIVKEGAKIVGGCCGTTPEYIRKTIEALDNLTENAGQDVLVKHTGREKKSMPRINPFAEKLARGEKVIAVELNPPSNADIAGFDANAKMLKEAGIDILTIADSPIARARADSSILACRVKRELGLDALPHITCRDRNINATKALLLGLNIEGINNVLIVTGDPIPNAMRDEVKSVFNFNSRMLAKYVNTLNETVFENKFLICAALNVNALNFDIQLQLAKEKEANGVSVLLTQPVMTAEGLDNLRRAKEELKGKILAGVMPIVSYRNACFMESEVSGIHVDQQIIELFKGKEKEESIELGIKIGAEIMKRVEPYCDGYYLMAPFGRGDIICRMLEKFNGQ